MAENAISVQKKGEESEFSMKGLLNRFRKKKNSKKEEYSSQVHPTIPSELSQAWEVARPYRPSMVLNLQTIKEEDPSKTPSCQDPLRTPLYFTNGTHNRRFRFRLRRYAKLIWRMHYAARLRHNFKSVLRIFRTRREPKVPDHSCFSTTVSKINTWFCLSFWLHCYLLGLWFRFWKYFRIKRTAKVKSQLFD